jgi:hypothetical protein
MIVNYAIYDKSTGEILSTGICPEDLVKLQATQEHTAVYIGAVSQADQKIDLTTQEPTDKTDDEVIDYRYRQVRFQTPDLYDINDIDDAALNERIEVFYFGQVTATTWRTENYKALRKAAYSNISDRADAAVKIKRGTKTGNAELVAEGESQLDALDDHDWAVKERFPKE